MNAGLDILVITVLCYLCSFLLFGRVSLKISLTLYLWKALSTQLSFRTVIINWWFWKKLYRT